MAGDYQVEGLYSKEFIVDSRSALVDGERKTFALPFSIYIEGILCAVILLIDLEVLLLLLYHYYDRKEWK